MKEQGNNIYQTSRLNASFTQEEAAELLDISIRSIVDYETDRRIPNETIVYEMCRIYDSNTLGYEHLRNSTKLGKKLLPKLILGEVSQTILSFKKEKKDVIDIADRIVEIGMDNKIDDQEVDDWQDITKEVSELAGAALSLLYLRQGSSEEGKYECV